jgi:hypothetical protein
MKTYVINDLTYKLLNPYTFIHLVAKNDDMIANHIIDYYNILFFIILKFHVINFHGVTCEV